MEKISTLFYSVQQGMKNIRRNKMFSLASIGTITTCLFLVGIFYFILSNFQYMIKNAESSVAITVFFDEGIGKEKMERIGQDIRLRAEVAQVNFISAEDAWDRFKSSTFEGQEELVDTFEDDNPLVDSASYEIYLNDISMQSSLVKGLEVMDGVRKVNSFDTTAHTLSSFNKLVGMISFCIIVILVSVSVFLISTTVSMGISVRKEEIAIMRMIGATDFFVQGPFIVEGLLIGVIGTVIPLIALSLVYTRVIENINTHFSDLLGVLTFLDASTIFSMLIPVSFGIGIGIGFVGSFLTVKKHLRV